MKGTAQSLGLSIIEVVLAMAVLAIGVFAAFSMQSGSLQATRTATITQELSNIALSEIELQRAFTRDVRETATGLTCRTSYEKPAYTCSVTVHPCTYAGSTLTCNSGSLAEGVVSAARQIIVTVTGPQGRQASLATVAR